MKIARRIILSLVGLMTTFSALATLSSVLISMIAINDNLPETHEYVEMAIAYGVLTSCGLALLIWQARRRLREHPSDS